ncbi:GNAT family N-acetyltransferase [Sporobolomyces salmoneus]|uniref:GNAT family N-acetyltransferase n=1 Tax=Sporobolomyces salmoneus TaxID=183962 RepID=UPI003175842D
MSSVPSFSTPRLTFRSPEPSDYSEPEGFLCKLFNSEIVQHGLSGSPARPQSKQEVEKWFTQLGDGAALHCVVCLRDTSDTTEKGERLNPVGWIILDKIAMPHRKATFGLAIATEHAGKGYAKEAMEWLLERAFNGFGLNKVEGEVFGWNERALKAYKSVGFVEEGVRRQTLWQNGVFIDDYIIGILASEWRERNRKL